MLTCYRRQTDTPSEPYCKSGLLIGKAFQGFLSFSKEKPLISYEISGFELFGTKIRYFVIFLLPI